MPISQIYKIKNYRVFRDFIWKKGLPDFSEKNLIYGWNGTGKTSLSDLFRSIEKREPILDGDIEFKINGESLSGSDINSSKNLPQIRVFNKDFVDTNVFTTNGSIAPIFFLGEKSIEKQKEIESYEDQLKQLEQESIEQELIHKSSKKEFGDFLTNQAKSIRDLLSSSGGKNSYNNYDKRFFEKKCEEFLNLSNPERITKILNEQDLNDQKKKIASEHLEMLETLKIELPDIEDMIEKVRTLLKKTVTASIIEYLENNKELSEWVRTGLKIHKDTSEKRCLFCGQDLPPASITKLESHFNDQYNTFIGQIDGLMSEMKTSIAKLNSIRIPNCHELYSHLRNAYEAKSNTFRENIKGLTENIQILMEILDEKKKKPFQPVDRSFDFIKVEKRFISDLNDIIAKHNNETDNFQTSMNNARLSIEESQVASQLVEYKEKKRNQTRVEERSNNLKKAIDSMRMKIDDLTKDIIEHRRPAEELNSDLCSYLGCKDISVRIQDNGYQIVRDNLPAKKLSEGEKTAIAFLYYLKSLNDRSFSLKDGIVVIDDPVSSLDSNSLYHAFGLMKEKTKDAKQLFILTHSHSFFRQVKNWFNHLPNQNSKDEEKRPARFYMLVCKLEGKKRVSEITKLDSLLHKFESEYHYLFHLVYKGAHSEYEQNFEHNYYLPNVARRLLETFLAFRRPTQEGLSQKLNKVDFDGVKKTKILRFLHTYSHESQFDDTGYDPSILIETDHVLKDILDLIQSVDKEHHAQMIELVENNENRSIA